MTSNAPHIANSRLLANWLLLDSPQILALTVPDYNPPLVKVIATLGMDCTHPVMPYAEAAPVVCSNCLQVIGSVRGLAVSADGLHAGCVQTSFCEPPWFRTPGLYMVAYAAFKHTGRQSIQLLTHYLIQEFVAGNHLARRTKQREQKLDELSRYYVKQAVSAGFERIESLT